MAKTIEKTKSALKLRTQAKTGVLTLRLGTKKYTLPVEARLITSSEFVFLHIPPTAEIMKIDSGSLAVVEDMATAEKAVASFRQRRKRAGGRGAKSTEMPSELASALSKIPAGFRLGYGPDGKPKLVKTRKRSK